MKEMGSSKNMHHLSATEWPCFTHIDGAPSSALDCRVPPYLVAWVCKPRQGNCQCKGTDTEGKHALGVIGD